MAIVYTIPSAQEQEKRLQDELEATETELKELEQQLEKGKEANENEVQKRRKCLYRYKALTVLFLVVLLVYTTKLQAGGKLAPIVFLSIFVVMGLPAGASKKSKLNLEGIKKKISHLEEQAEEIKNQLSRIQKGDHGELQCCARLKQLPDTYYIFSDLEVPYQGGVVQIDNIVVGPNGIFVIEVKNYSGYIAGYADLPFWTQYTEYNGFWKSIEIKNFVKQNWRHAMALKEYVLRSAIEEIWVTPIVVFCREDTNITAIHSPMMDIKKLSELNQFILEQKTEITEPTIRKVMDCLKELAGSRWEAR